VDSTVQLGGGLKLPFPRSSPNGVKSIVFGIRPEHIYVRPSGKGGEVPVPSVVEVVEPLGHDVVATASCGAGVFQLAAEIHDGLKPQDQIDLQFDMERAYLFDRDTECVL
jgi:multiple sugar transport system ATP-binding protein